MAGSDPGVTIWMMTRVEVISAIARKKRERPELAGLCNRAILDVREAACNGFKSRMLLPRDFMLNA